MVVGILIRDGLVLACQRKRDVPYALQWEFPGGKIEDGESPGQALVRELREELSIRAEIGPEFSRQRWTYPEHSSGGTLPSVFDITFLLIRSFEGEPTNNAFEQIRWVTPAELSTMDILEGNKETVRRLVRYAQEQDFPN